MIASWAALEILDRSDLKIRAYPKPLQGIRISKVQKSPKPEHLVGSKLQTYSDGDNLAYTPLRRK